MKDKAKVKSYALQIFLLAVASVVVWFIVKWLVMVALLAFFIGGVIYIVTKQ